MELDAELDNAIKALDDALVVSLKAFGEASPRGEAATFARSRLSCLTSMRAWTNGGPSPPRATILLRG